MKCEEVLEHISSGVDGYLSGKLLNEFNEHIQECKNCRNAYELEKITKKYLSSKLKPLQTPEYLNQKIISQIDSILYEQSPKITKHFFKRPWRKWYFGFAVTAIAVLILFVIPKNPHHLHTSPDDDNFIHMIYNNYDSIVEGKMIPEFSTSSREQLESHFMSAVDYKINVPNVRECTLVGGSITKFNENKLTHFIYKHNNCVIYFSQVDFRVIINEHTIYLSPNALEELVETGWYVDTKYECCPVILWLEDSTLCAAASEMEKDRLMAYLSEEE